MKKLMFMLGFTMIAIVSQAQKVKSEDVPTAVKSSLETQFPNAKELEWEKEGANYEAEFKLNNTEHSVIIDPNGNILETEVEIKVDELPAKARQYIAEKYPTQKVEETARITLANGTIQYEAEINGKDLMFDANGTFIQEKK